MIEQLKTLQEGIQKKASNLLYHPRPSPLTVRQVKDLNAAKGKIPYKTVAEVDERIK